MEKVIIYHTDVDPKTASPDDLDVFDQAKFVSENLKKLGYLSIKLPFRLDFSDKDGFDASAVQEELREIKPRFIFNLVEAVNGSDSLNYLAPLVFEKMKVRYTGCTYSSFIKTEHKVHAKEILAQEGIATPYYATPSNIETINLFGKRFLIKSDSEHASKNLEERLYTEREEIKRVFKEKNGAFFAEEYIEGREFNISCIGMLGKGLVLPVAEMEFKNWKKDKLKIVGYTAKWEDDSYESVNTVRNFSFPESDRELIRELEQITRQCWNVFDLRGYARVDFRVSEQRKPYVLEINANPCIAPDAGFIAAAKKAGLTPEIVIKKIIEATIKQENTI